MTGAEGLRRIDGRVLDPSRDEILCLACARNERLRLPHFLDHHRRLGVQRFLIVDNDSDDGTLDLLLSEPDVHVFFTAERYSVGNYGLRWVNALLSSHAIGHWTLTVDLDELLVYPACEETSLGRLAASLERRGEEAVVAFMLDMYSDLAICDTTYLPGRPFLDACAYFDGDDYEWDPAHPLYRTVPLSGGPRRRLFWSADSPFGRPPFLPKVPLAKWRAGLAYTVSTHYLDGARLSGLTAALLHFKFFSDFVTRAAEEAQRGEHWQNAAEYAVYARVLQDRPDLGLMYDRSVRYRDSGQLVSLGLLRVPATPFAAGERDASPSESAGPGPLHS